MNASELMIGNWVFANNVNENRLVPKKIDDGKDIDNAYWFWPIPLTTELLQKAGFLVYDDFDNHSVDFYKMDGIRIQVCRYEPMTFDLVYYDEKQKQYGKPIEHLHTLQNLIFAFTGSPLTIEM